MIRVGRANQRWQDARRRRLRRWRRRMRATTISKVTIQLLLQGSHVRGAAKEYEKAIAAYTSGIEIFPLAVLFNNRAMVTSNPHHDFLNGCTTQAHMKLENWGSVIADTTSALELDESLAKVTTLEVLGQGQGLDRVVSKALAGLLPSCVCSNRPRKAERGQE